MPKSAPTGEFELIDHYFKNKTLSRKDVVLGIGDDAALLVVPPQQLLVIAVDTMAAGVHFPLNTSPDDIGYKALAVNLSDLAAMGAEPAWLTLALTMPRSDPAWLEAFSHGLLTLANQYQMQLIGGDTTRGPLTITVAVHGFVPQQHALRRSGARAGDRIYVSGTLGDAGLGLLAVKGLQQLSAEAEQYVLSRLNRPEPRVALGLLLRDYASSAIDVSDGLLADLQHILDASQVGADIMTKQLPLSKILREHTSADEAVKLALTSGDDYELCFTVSPEQESAMLAKLKEAGMVCTLIGVVVQKLGIHLQDSLLDLGQLGYNHFS